MLQIKWYVGTPCALHNSRLQLLAARWLRRRPRLSPAAHARAALSAPCPIDPNKDWSHNFTEMVGYKDPMFTELMRLYLTIHRSVK